MEIKSNFRAGWYKKSQVVETGNFGKEDPSFIDEMKLEIQQEIQYVRVLIYGVPGAPIFELGEDLSNYYDIDLFELSRDYEEYFISKIPGINVDIGDRDSGSASQRMERDPSSVRKRRAIDRFLNIPNVQPDPLSWEDKIKLYGIPNGIIVTEVAEAVLIQWIEKGKGIVFFIDIDEEKAVDWLKQRRKCLSCGSMFHKTDNPEKFEGICNRCGTDLIYREQDKPENVRHQFNIWRQDFTDFKRQMGKQDMILLDMDKINYNGLFSKMTIEINERFK